MNSEREIGDEELMDVAHDREQAHRLHKALRTLAGNHSVGGRLQHMAREVLSGRIGMRDAIQDERYMDALGERIGEIRRNAENQTHAEREQMRDQIERWREQKREEEEQERAELDGPTQGVLDARQRPGRRPR